MNPSIRNASSPKETPPSPGNAAIREHGPTLLTELELDLVAAAGSKPGVSGGAGAEVWKPPVSVKPK